MQFCCDLKMPIACKNLKQSTQSLVVGKILIVRVLFFCFIVESEYNKHEKKNSMKSQIKTNKTLGIFKNTWKVTEFCVVVKLLPGERGA